jgi:hypothetical protein
MKRFAFAKRFLFLLKTINHEHIYKNYKRRNT